MHGEILMIALVLAAALIGGRVAVRFGYPSILGELAAGILLGPPLLGVLSSNDAIEVLGEVGVLLMMLYIGMHLHLGDLRRASMPGLFAAIGGFLVPAGLGFALMVWVGRTFFEALFVGLAMGVTSLATKSRILVDLKILDTRIAHVLVAAALLSDVAVLIVFAAVVGPGATDGGVSLVSAGITGLKALGFGLAAWLIGSRLLPLVKKLIRGREIDRGAAFLAVVVFGLTFAWGAEAAGIHAILGAFIAGLVIDEGAIDAKVSRDVQGKLAGMSVGFLAPFFFVSAGFEVSLSVFRTDLLLLLSVIVLATLGKIFGTALFYLLSGNGWREGVVVGSGMNGRGAVEIIVAELALAQGLIDTDVFSILVFMAIFTTATVPVLLTLGVRWLRRRGELVKAGNRNQVMIIGAGAFARALASVLKARSEVTLLDTNRANLVAGERDDLEVVYGSGLDEVTLEEAGIANTAQLIAATPNAEVNVLTAQLAVDFGVPEVSVVLRDSDTRTFNSQLSAAGIAVIRAPEDIAGWEHAIASGRAERSTVEVERTLDLARNGWKPPWPDDPSALPLAVVNHQEPSPYTSLTTISAGDEVILLRRDGVPAFTSPDPADPESVDTQAR